MSTPSALPQSHLQTACHIEQNQVLELNQPEQAWKISSGTVALCRVVDGIRH